MSDRIITNNVYPPIPDRRFDWCAYHENDVESAWRYGWGSTKQEALDDLARLDNEYAEIQEDEAHFAHTTP